MAGQVSTYFSAVLANRASGAAAPVTTAPWANGATSGIVPGQYYVNSGTVETWDSGASAWVPVSTMLYYVALLTGDPSVAGTGGAYAQTVADIAAVEDTTPGYARQPVTFGTADGTAYPATVASTNTLTFGPYSSPQNSPVQWAALIESSSATGTSGNLVYMWTLPQSQQVNVSQQIQAGAGSLTMGES